MINDENDEKYIMFTDFIFNFLIAQRTNWTIEKPDEQVAELCKIFMGMVQEYYNEFLLDEMKDCRFTFIQGSSYEKSCMIVPCHNNKQSLYYIIVDKHLFDFYKVIIDIYKFDCDDTDNIILEDIQKLITELFREYAVMRNKEMGTLFFSLYSDSLHNYYHTYDSVQNPFNFVQLFFLITHELGHCFFPYMLQKENLIHDKRTFLLKNMNNINFLDITSGEIVNQEEITKLVNSEDSIIEECICDSIAIDCHLRFQEERNELSDFGPLFNFMFSILSSQIISFSSNIDNLDYHNSWLIRIIHFLKYSLDWYARHDKESMTKPFLYSFVDIHNKFVNRIGKKSIQGLIGYYKRLNNLYSIVDDSNYKSYYNLNK